MNLLTKHSFPPRLNSVTSFLIQLIPLLPFMFPIAKLCLYLNQNTLRLVLLSIPLTHRGVIGSGHPLWANIGRLNRGFGFEILPNQTQPSWKWFRLLDFRSVDIRFVLNRIHTASRSRRSPIALLSEIPTAGEDTQREERLHKEERLKP